MLGLYAEFIKIKWRSASQFRGAFLLTMVSKIAGLGAQFATLYILVQRFNALGGWTASQVLSLFALFQMSYAIGACFTFHASRSLDKIARNGGMDALLTKPVNPLLYILANHFSTGYTGNLTISTICLILGLSSSGVTITIGGVLLIIVTVLGGAMIHGGLMMLTSIPAIYMVDTQFRDLLYWRVTALAEYPITIYPLGVRILLSFILPYAFIAFYPAQALFGITPLFHPTLQYVSPVIGLALCAVVYRFFGYAIKKYQGSGT